MLARMLLVVAAALAVPDLAEAAVLDVRTETERGRRILVIEDTRPTDADGVELVFSLRPGDRLRAQLDDVPADAFARVPAGCNGTTSDFTCEPAFLTDLDRIEIQLGDSRDVVQDSVVPVPFTIFGGKGPDSLEGGTRDDIIDVGEAGSDPSFADFAGGADGDDLLRQTIVPFPVRRFFTGVGMKGGNGNDELVPSPLTADDEGFDTFLDGGAGEDTITGTRADDDIAGGLDDDRILAGAGDDRIDPGVGEDRVDAASGDDTLLQLPDPRRPFSAVSTDGTDVLNGGSGRDTVDYGARLTPLQITVNDTAANDGAADEHDQLLGVERAVGGKAGDTFFGFARLDDDIPDDFTGGESSDTLLGGDGDDRLDGGTGADTLRGGTDDDVLLARDGFADTVIACDSGQDEAAIDLTDPEPTGCELVVRRAVHEPRGVDVLGGGVLVRRGGRVRVGVRCPPTTTAGCRGTVRLTAGGVTREAAFALRRGRRRVLAFRAPHRGAATIRTSERGRRGLRTTTRRVRLA